MGTELQENALSSACKGLGGGDRFVHTGRAKATVNFSGCEVTVEVRWDRDAKVQDARPCAVQMRWEFDSHAGLVWGADLG